MSQVIAPTTEDVRAPPKTEVCDCGVYIAADTLFQYCFTCILYHFPFIPSFAVYCHIVLPSSSSRSIQCYYSYSITSYVEVLHMAVRKNLATTCTAWSSA